jgi:hypothetical protein
LGKSSGVCAVAPAATESTATPVSAANANRVRPFISASSPMFFARAAVGRSWLPQRTSAFDGSLATPAGGARQARAAASVARSAGRARCAQHVMSVRTEPSFPDWRQRRRLRWRTGSRRPHRCGICSRSARGSGFLGEPRGCSQRAVSVVPSVSISTTACTPVSAASGRISICSAAALASSDRHGGRARTGPA